MFGLAMTAVDCARTPPRHAVRAEQPPRANDLVVHAFETQMETRLIDRLELDNFLRERDIRVEFVDGTVNLTGAVWTPLEKERAGELIRSVPGVIDVANDLDILPPG